MIPLGEHLAPNFRVYAPDMPGYGHSAKPLPALTVPELAEALAAWMADIGLKKAVLVGNSFGCQVIAELATHHPELVQRAVLVGPTVDVRARTLVHQAARLFLDMFVERPSLIPVVGDGMLRMGPVRAWQSVRYMLDDRIEDKLPAMSMPVLLVRGARDRVAPRRWIEELAALLPHWEWAEIPDAPHCPNYSAPEELARVIVPFMASTGAE